MKNYVSELKGKIHEKFHSESECARALGWKKQRLNAITTGRKIPSIIELNEIAKVLDIPFNELTDIFLRCLSTNEQQSA